MDKQDDGGAAFPTHYDDLDTAREGMSLRDYFAAKAMQGFLAAREAPHAGEDGEVVLAKDSYIVADAMLAEREK